MQHLSYLDSAMTQQDSLFPRDVDQPRGFLCCLARDPCQEDLLGLGPHQTFQLYKVLQFQEAVFSLETADLAQGLAKVVPDALPGDVVFPLEKAPQLFWKT